MSLNELWGKTYRSPDEGGGAGGGTATPAESISTPPATIETEDNLAVDKFVNSVNKSIDNRSWTKSKEREHDNEQPLSPGDRPLNFGGKEPTVAQAIEAEINKASTNTQPVVDQNQPAEDSSVKKTEEPVKVEGQPTPEEIQKFQTQLRNQVVQINGQNFTVEQTIEMAQYYDKLAETIDTKKAELEKHSAEIEAYKNSPEQVIVKALQDNPNLRERFKEWARENSESSLNKIETSTMAQRLESLESQLKEERSYRERAIQQQQQRVLSAQEEQVRRAGNEIRARAHEEGKRLGIPERRIESALKETISEIQFGRLKPDRGSIESFVMNALKEESEFISGVRNDGKNTHLQEKRNAPLPPPSGGSTPRIQPQPIREFGRGLQKQVRGDLESALSKL